MRLVLDSGLLLDAGGLPGEASEVVQAGAPDLAASNHLDLLEAGRVQIEGALDADAVGDAADREVRAGASVVLADDDALEDLGALALAFDDLGADLHGIAGTEAFDAGIVVEFNEIACIHIPSIVAEHLDPGNL